MSLHLDARQRAMLQEMGVTVWAPAEAPVPAAEPLANPAHSQRTATGPAVPPAPVAAADTRTAPAPRTVRERVAPPAAAAAAVPPTPQGASAAPALILHAAQALYPTADAAQTPAELGAGWLVVAESLSPTDPLAGEAGRLLDNMLRAMRLHRHPRVYLAALGGCRTGSVDSENPRLHPNRPQRGPLLPDLQPHSPAMGQKDSKKWTAAADLQPTISKSDSLLERPQAGTAADAIEIAPALTDMVTTLRPAMVLVLGHGAARAALARTEPLGRLRAELHQLAGCPAIVTYDPAFLLRSQGYKAAAWADLCRALALVHAAPGRS
jgi:DNA polymerase